MTNTASELLAPQPAPKYFFCLQIKSKWGADWFMTSSFAYETFEQYREAANSSGSVPDDDVVAYTRIPESAKRAEEILNDLHF